MKNLPEVEQSNDDQFHAFMAMFLNSYKDMRGKISKAGMQKLIGDKDRLTNEMILWLNSGGMPEDGHVFKLNEPLWIDEGKIVADFKEYPDFVWGKSMFSILSAGKCFLDFMEKDNHGTYLDINRLRASALHSFANDCLLDHLYNDFPYLIPSHWDTPIIAIGTAYKIPKHNANEFWYKVLIPKRNGVTNPCIEWCYEKLYLESDTMQCYFKNAHILMF